MRSVLKFFVSGKLVMKHQDIFGETGKTQRMWYHSIEIGDGLSENYSLTFPEIAPRNSVRILKYLS